MEEKEFDDMSRPVIIKFCFACSAAIDIDSEQCPNCDTYEDAQSQFLRGRFENDVSSIFGVSAEYVIPITENKT